MIQILVKEMCNISYKDERGMPFMNFKIVNAEKWKNYQSMACLFTEILFIKRGFFEKKTRARKLKIQGKHMTLTSLLIFSPGFNQERELCNTSVVSSHTWIIKKFNYLQAGKGEIKGMDICYMKRNPYNKIRQGHVTYMSIFLITAVIGMFLSNYLPM